MLITLNFKPDTKHIIHQLQQLLEQQRQKIAEVAQIENPTWETLVLPLDQLSDELNQFWTPLNHLNSVASTTEIREAYQAGLPLLSDFYSDLGQNQQLCAAYHKLRDSDHFQQLDTAQQRVVELALRDFKLSGVDLSEQDKKTDKRITARLSELSTQFENNIIDATQAWYKHITNIEQLAGIPESRLQAMQAAAKTKDLTGYVVTLDYPCYHDVITYADNEKLREEIYQAFSTRASEQGPNAGNFDNSAITNEILTLRQQRAKLLGFNHFAELSLVPKMAHDTQQVSTFLQELANKVKPHAEQDLQQLTEFAQSIDPKLKTLSAWDVAYYSEKLRQQQYAIAQQTIKQYFPAEHVLQGLFSILDKLFAIRFELVEQANLWHDDVKFYQIFNSDNQCIGGIYMDLYAREFKRQGAWMDDAVCRHRLADGQVQWPIAFLTCNFAAATTDTPALLTHNDVETLFHEMGHCLQHLLTDVDYLDVSGINNVAWDAVEFPSQFLESWVWQPECLQLLSQHYQTGESLPSEMIEKMIAAKNFQAGLFLIRQLEFGIFDFRLHCIEQITDDVILKTLQQVREEIAVMQPPSYNRFACSFSHIFAGGYAAGYYSYLWAEVLARDAFSLFIKQGLFDQTLGVKFKNTVLALGGSEPAENVFEKFMGRRPDANALLLAYGL